MWRPLVPGTAHPAARSILVLVVVVLFLAVIPVPYFLIGPGSALDLTEAITVHGHAPPRDRYYLTDVSLQHATILALAQLLLPGFRLVPQKTIVPEGIPADTYETLESDYMDESQDVAAVVAERAAGYQVAVVPRTVVAAFAANAPSQKVLARGDQLRSVNGRAVHTTTDVVTALEGVKAGQRVPVVVVRQDKVLHLSVPTAEINGKPRFGIIVAQRYAKPVLPVPVTFHIDNISGSSGGLMFALDIYRSLHPKGSGVKIAGTGDDRFRRHGRADRGNAAEADRRQTRRCEDFSRTESELRRYFKRPIRFASFRWGRSATRSARYRRFPASGNFSAFSIVGFLKPGCRA